MHFMTGCSLYKACNATRLGVKAVIGADPTLCDPFQQLATICARDKGMSKMAGCTVHYTSMCANGSVVPQCKRMRGADLLTTEDANKWVRSICEEMTMEGCERCTPAWEKGQKWGGPNCDPFAVYGWLCVQMPDMWQCIGPGRWDEMCKKDPTLYACVGDAPALTDKGWWRPGSDGGGASGGGDSGGGDSGGSGGEYRRGPSMRMYFFNDMPFWLLFKEWVPETTGQLAGAWFAIFFMGVFYELVQTVKFRMEASWLAADAQQGAPQTAAPLPGPQLDTSRARGDSSDAYETSSSVGIMVHIPRQEEDEDGKPPRGGGEAARTCCGSGAAAPGPVGEGAEGGGCCSGSRPSPPDIAALTVPLSPALPKGVSTGPMRRRAGLGRAPEAPGCSWLRQQQRPGGWMDGKLLGRDVTRGVMTFLTTALSYLLMLAAMSFHIGIFLAVCSGIAVGTAVFGRYRSNVAATHQDRCCC